MKNESSRIVSSKVVATFWGVSTKTVERLVSQGIIRKHGRGLYDLLECNLAYCEYLRQNGGTNPDDINWKERHKKAQTEKEEELVIKHRLGNQQARGELLSLNDIMVFVSGLLVMFRTALLQLPTELAFELGLNTTDEAIIRDKTETLLHELHQASLEFSNETEPELDEAVGKNQ